MHKNLMYVIAFLHKSIVRYNTTCYNNRSNQRVGDSIATSNAQKRAVKKYQEKMKRVPLDMPKDTYEWVKTCAEYVGETVNGFIKRAAYERAALECDPSPEGAAKKLEEKRAERKAYLDSLEQTVVDGKTVYSSGKTEVGGETGSGVLKK